MRAAPYDLQKGLVVKKLVGVVLTMLALVAATPAQAQADDRFGAAFSFLRWDGENGAPGFLVDYSKQLITQQNMATSVFGEMSLHRWGGIFPETDIFVHGGVRQYFMTDNSTVQPYAHFMVGFLRWSG